MSRYQQRQQSQVSQVSIPMEELAQEWRPIFDRFDRDKDGVVPLDEFREMLQHVEMEEQLPVQVVDEILECADADKNGKLDFDEFLHMVKAHELSVSRPLLHRLLLYATYAVVPRSERRRTTRKYIQQYSCKPPPLFIMGISIVEFAVYIYYAVTTVSEKGWLSVSGPIPFESPLIYDPTKRYEAWRFLTYMLIHAGIYHIVFNLIVQLALGIPLEMVHHWWRIMIVYLCGVIAGSLGTSIADPTVYLAGASAGAYALITAHLANVVLNWSEMDFAPFRLAAILIITGSDLTVAIYSRYVKEENDNKVGYAAHLGGAVAGLLIGINVLRNLRVRTFEKIIWWVSLAVYCLLMFMAIIWNIVYPSYFPPANHGEQ